MQDFWRHEDARHRREFVQSLTHLLSAEHGNLWSVDGICPCYILDSDGAVKTEIVTNV